MLKQNINSITDKNKPVSSQETDIGSDSLLERLLYASASLIILVPLFVPGIDAKTWAVLLSAGVMSFFIAACIYGVWEGVQFSKKRQKRTRRK